jgi:TPP-dependent pyruvate/acetoin dehydrogenase alpha subunit
MGIINEFRTLQDVLAWIGKDGLEQVAYRLWDDEFYPEWSVEEIEKELIQMVDESR